MMQEIDDEELVKKLKANWAEFSALANELSKRGFFVSIESGWEAIDAPIDEEITQIIVQAPSPVANAVAA